MHDAATERAVAIEPLGETLLLLSFGDRIDAEVNQRVHRAAAALRAAQLPGLIDLVPAYATLGLVYAPAAGLVPSKPPWRTLADAVEAVLAQAATRAAPDAATIDIPVHYGGAGGPDLDDVARHCGLAASEIIQRHSAGQYTVAMIGFAPGFPYLLGLDSALHTPRRADPRTRVPRGSVAIGGAQTGIYPSDLPGGWNLLGRTPLRLFDAQRDPPCLLAPGDHVRFHAIDAREFAALDATAAP